MSGKSCERTTRARAAAQSLTKTNRTDLSPQAKTARRRKQETTKPIEEKRQNTSSKKKNNLCIQNAELQDSTLPLKRKNSKRINGDSLNVTEIEISDCTAENVSKRCNGRIKKPIESNKQIQQVQKSSKKKNMNTELQNSKVQDSRLKRIKHKCVANGERLKVTETANSVCKPIVRSNRKIKEPQKSELSESKPTLKRTSRKPVANGESVKVTKPENASTVENLSVCNSSVRSNKKVQKPIKSNRQIQAKIQTTTSRTNSKANLQNLDVEDSRPRSKRIKRKCVANGDGLEVTETANSVCETIVRSNKKIKEPVEPTKQLQEKVQKSTSKKSIKADPPESEVQDSKPRRITRKRVAEGESLEVTKSENNSTVENISIRVRSNRKVKKPTESKEQMQEKIRRISSKSNSKTSVQNSDVKDSTLSHKGVANELKVQLHQNNRKKTEVMKLRKRKCVDYGESSLEVTKTETGESRAKRVPVYKQQMAEPEQPKSQEDLYEFNSDSERQKKNKRRKLDDDSSIDEYNKTIQNILQKIANRVRNRNRKVVISDKNKVMKNVAKKVPSKPRAVKESNNNQPVVTTIAPPPPKNASTKVPSTPALLNTSNATAKSTTNDISDCFGFSGPHSSNIHIIGNIILPPNKELNLSIKSPKQFEHCRPNANSTMLNVLTPWRFNEINIRRNPHFIEIKKSNLPSISQEMVLDHTIVDKFNDLSRCENENSVVNTNTPKKSVQKTLNEYFEGNSSAIWEDKENVRDADSSIFDIDQWSPVKTPRKMDKPDLVKRKVLGQQNTNIISSTPIRNQQQESQVMDFGFDSIEKGGNQLVDDKRTKEDKPFRVSINANVKKYSKKTRFQPIQRAESVKSSGEESDVSEPSDLEDNGEIRLFEDIPEPKQDLSDESRKPRTKKLRWMAQSPKIIKKRKDLRTKAEEKEAEQWAVSFNAMCAEVDQFPLEVE